MTRWLAALLAVAVMAPAASAAAKTWPDLVAKSVKGQPKTLVAGTRFTVRVTVRNSGNRRAGKSTLALYLTRGTRLSKGALSIGRVRVPALRPHKARTLKVKAKLPPVKASARALPQGDYRILACADATHKVRERNERNDCRAESKAVIRLRLSNPAPQPSGPSPPGTPSGPGAPGFAMSDGFDWTSKDQSGNHVHANESIPITLRAANGLPGAAGYTRSAVAHENPPAGTTTDVPVSDPNDGIATVALPFSFDFAGIPFDSVSVGANGWVSFDAPAWDWWDDAEPYDFRGENAVVGHFYRGLMPYWGDLDITSGPAISDASLTETVAPGNASVTFAWHAGQCCGGGVGPARNFSVTLFPDGSFRYDYGSPNDDGGQLAFVGYSAGDGSLDNFAADTKSVPSTSLLYTPKPLPAAGALPAGTMTTSIPRGTTAGALDTGCAVVTPATALQDGQISCAVPALAPGQSFVRHVSWLEVPDEMSDNLPTRDYSGAYTPGGATPLTNEDELTVEDSFLPDEITGTTVTYTDTPHTGSPTTFQVQPNTGHRKLLNPVLTIQLPDNTTLDSIKVDGLTDDYPSCRPPSGGSVTCLLPTADDLKKLDVTVTPTAAAEGSPLTLSASTHADNASTVNAGQASSSGNVTP